MTLTKQQQLECISRMIPKWNDAYRYAELMTNQSINITAYHFTNNPPGDNAFITRDEWYMERYKMQKQAAQQAQDNQWHERGEFPPAGCECEAFADCCEPEVCTILAIHNGTAAVKWSKFNNGGLDVITLNGWSLRPLRTEREKAIDEIAALVRDGLVSPEMAKEFAVKMYDAGLKVVKR